MSKRRRYKDSPERRGELAARKARKLAALWEHWENEAALTGRVVATPQALLERGAPAPVIAEAMNDVNRGTHPGYIGRKEEAEEPPEEDVDEVFDEDEDDVFDPPDGPDLPDTLPEDFEPEEDDGDEEE